jgi:hypothetical protein
VNAIEGNVVRLFEIEVFGNDFNALSTSEINSYKHQFKIYPNPTSSLIYIDGNDEVESIVVFDLNAKVLMRNQGSRSIDVSQLSAGTYVVSVNNAETFKFIKKSKKVSYSSLSKNSSLVSLSSFEFIFNKLIFF